MTMEPLSSPKPLIQQPNYTGAGGAFYGLYLKMFFLMIVTFGVYRSWGKTNVRRYIWSSIRVDDEPFAYLGTGKELFRSALKFVLLLFVPAFIFGIMAAVVSHGKDTPFTHIARILSGVILFVFFYAAKFMGLRYRMSRTSWRGIRFELRGRVRDYLLLRVKNLIFNLLSLGLYRPLGDVEVLKFVINRCYFGTLPFRYNGQAEELQKTYYLSWLLFVPTLGMSIFWYRAKYIAHVAKYTTLDSVQFRVAFTGWEYLRFHLANILMTVFSLGLAYPYVAHRKIQIYASHMKFRGMIDEGIIQQAQKSQGSEGAELTLAFDDFGF